MKPKILPLKRPHRIFQIFRNINIYGKDEKSFEQRKNKVAWSPISSCSGYVKDEVVYLPEAIAHHPDFASHDSIVLLDDHLPPAQLLSLVQEGIVFLRENKNNQLDIFSIRLRNKIEIYLKYGYFEVGGPKRDDFKLCELRINEPVEVKINGKTDFSLSGRRARMYVEQDYIFNYLGEVTAVGFLKAPIAPVTKEIPTRRKLVDLNKTLW